jgi:hypothetical protein
MGTTRKIKRAGRKVAKTKTKTAGPTRASATKVATVSPATRRAKRKGKRVAGAQRADQKRAQAKRDSR